MSRLPWVWRRSWNLIVGIYVRPAARTTVRQMANRCLGDPEALGSLLSSITTGMSAFRTDLDSGPLAERLAENVPTGPYQMQLLVAQGEADPNVPPAAQADFVAGLCAAGTDVEYRTYPGLDHVPLVEADSPLVPYLIDWTEQRFAGESFTGNCPG